MKKILCWLGFHTWVNLGSFGPIEVMPYCEDWCNRCHRIQEIPSEGFKIMKRGKDLDNAIQWALKFRFLTKLMDIMYKMIGELNESIK